MSTITRERVAQYANDPRMCNVNDEIRQIARIALASLEAEPVISHVGSKNALDAIVAFIKSNRNPTLKVYNEVSERLFQDNCHGLSNHVIEYIKQIGEELEELRSTQDTAPPAPVSVPDERAAFNAWNNDTDCPLAGRDAKTAAWLAWSRRAAMLQGADGNYPVIPDGLRLALSNAGIAAPESDEMLAATCEKYIQELVTWVKDRKPFRSVAPQQEA